MLDHIERVLRGDAPPPPIALLLGFELTSVKPGEAVIEFEATEAHANPMGTLHGGVLCDIADAAMGLAYAANLGEGETFTTLELKINFLKPIWKARLRSIGSERLWYSSEVLLMVHEMIDGTYCQTKLPNESPE